MRAKRAGQIVAATLLVMGTPAFAGSPGSITFGPLAAANVPTLGTAVLVLLTLLLAFIGWVYLRKNGPGAVPVVTFALALASASGAGGLTWLQTAEAGGGFVIKNSGGQTFSISDGVQNNYFNGVGVPMQPTSITLPASCSLSTNPGTCTVGTPLSQGNEKSKGEGSSSFCNLDCSDGGDP